VRRTDFRECPTASLLGVLQFLELLAEQRGRFLGCRLEVFDGLFAPGARLNERPSMMVCHCPAGALRTGGTP